MKKPKIHFEEYFAVGLSFVYFFCILTAYYIMRPIREQFSAEVGSSQLPLFFGTTFIATLLLTPVFAWLISRFTRQVVIPVVYLFFIACQLAFIPLFGQHDLLSTKSIALTFFVWVSVFNLFVVSVFWSFMTDIWTDDQARRLFPFIAVGGSLGAIMGPILTKSLVSVIGVAHLLLVSAGFLTFSILCVLFLANWAKKYSLQRSKSDDKAIGGGMLDGLKQIFSDPFVRSMSLLILLGDAIGTIFYALITDYSGATYFNDAVGRTRFAANIDLSANLLQIVVQLTLTRWLLVRYGAGFIFVLTASMVIIACGVLGIVENPLLPVIGSMPWIAIVLIITRGLSFGMVQPARETLFTLVPREIRYKAKNAMDTVVWRAGDIILLLLINGLRSLGTSIAGFGLISASLVAISGAIGWRLANRVEKNDPSH